MESPVSDPSTLFHTVLGLAVTVGSVAFAVVAFLFPAYLAETRAHGPGAAPTALLVHWRISMNFAVLASLLLIVGSAVVVTSLHIGYLQGPDVTTLMLMVHLTGVSCFLVSIAWFMSIPAGSAHPAPSPP